MNFSVHGEISMTASMSTTITLPQKCDRLRQSEAKDPQAQLLSTIAQVANLLLRSTDYTIILPDVMRLLGEAVGCDRCSVIQEIPGSDEIYALVEWSRPGINLTLETTLEMESLMVWSNFTSLHEQYARGESTNFLVADIEEPGRSILSAQGCTSMLIVPIMVAGKCWGEIGFDNCGEPRLYDDAEIAILRIAADSLAAAIERQAKDEELRKSEALYRSLFDISNEGIYYSQFNPPVQINLSIPEQIEQCYQRFCLTKANDTFAQMYGLERGEDMIGLKLSDVYLEASEKNQAFIRAVVENGHRVRNMESEEIDANGRKRYFLNSVINQIENNVAVGSWGTQIDITELREAQQALLQAERERVAQLEDYNQQLRSREYWLEATALAANALVSYPTLETALNEALRLIGETVGCDRAGILQHIQDETGTGFVRAIHEWNSQNTFSQLTTDHIAFSWSAMGLEDWLVRGQAGELCGGLLDELPEPFRSIQAELDVQATYNVPIFVAGQFWGVLGIDYCGEPKRLIAAEVGIFKTIASCIGSAIERQRIQAAILQAEREKTQELERLNSELQQTLDRLQARDRLLEVIAMAANALLTLDDFDQAVNTALQILGEGLQTDRVKVLECFFDDGVNSLPSYYAITHEWITPGTISQLSHPSSSRIDARDAEVSMRQVFQNDGFGGLLHEWHESLWSAFEEVQAQAIYCVPIRVDSQLWGIFAFDDCHEVKHRSPIELAVLKIGANCIGSAIERQRTQQALLEAEQRRVAELAKTNRALKNSIDRLAADPDLNAFLGHVLQAIAQELNAPVVEHWLDTADNQSYLNLSCCRGELLTSKQQADDPRVQGIHVTPDLMEHTNLLKRQRPCVFEDLVNDPRQRAVFDSIGFDLAAWSTKHNVQKYIHLPLLLGDESIGTLCIYIPGDRTFSQEQIELMQALAQQATLAIALTRLAEESHQLAIIRDRTHLAREIHDTLAQGYAGILMQIQAANFLKQQPDQAKVHLDRACVLAREGIADARRSVWLLQQESEAYSDVSHILVQLVEQMSIGAGIKPTVTIEGNPHNVPPDTGMHLLRITQESLNNALRHAKASKISIHLHYTSNQLQMTIQDDGCGFESEASTSGFGIKGMGQRADLIGAELQIHSQRDRGTQIELSISLA
jgi:PAS domain S-box-containing protein